MSSMIEARRITESGSGRKVSRAQKTGLFAVELIISGSASCCFILSTRSLTARTQE